MIGIMLCGVLLILMSAFFMWRQLSNGELNFGSLIFAIWLPGVAGSLMVAVSIILLLAKLVKAM